MPTRPSKAVESEPRLPRPARPAPRPDMVVRASMPQGRETRGCRSQNTGLWLSPRTAEISRTIAPRICWWLPPVIWPEEEEAIRRRLAHLTREGARHFVCNAPWQRDLFPAELLARQYGGNVWLYPGWPLDITAKRQELQQAGYSFFARLEENPPSSLPEMRRQGLFNWDGALL